MAHRRKTSKTNKKSDIEKQIKAKAALANAVKNAETKAAVPAKKSEPATAKKAETKKSEAKKPEPVATAKPASKPEKAAAKKETASAFSHIFEIDGDQINSNAVADRVREAYKAEGHQVGRIKKLDIYYNFSERRAYYVINDNAEGNFVEF